MRILNKGISYAGISRQSTSKYSPDIIFYTMDSHTY